MTGLTDPSADTFGGFLEQSFREFPYPMHGALISKEEVKTETLMKYSARAAVAVNSSCPG